MGGCLAPAALCLSIGGCASWAPPNAASAQAGPAVQVPAGWSAPDAAGAGSAGVNGDSLVAWWQRFDDPVMTGLVSRALAANTRIHSAQAALRQAQALRDVAAAALRLTLGATASAQRGTAGGESTGNRFQLGLEAQWVPDVFGARRSALDAGDAAAAASAASLGDVQVQVAAEVALNYIVLRAVQARWAIANDNLASQQETLQITDWRQQAGLVTTLQLEQARAAAAQTQALLPALHTSVQQTAHALAVLVGQAPASLNAELWTAMQTGLPSGLPDELRSDLRAAPTSAAGAAVPRAAGELAMGIPAGTLRQRADIRATEYQVAAALARVGQAQAQRWPSFAIGGSIGWSAISAAALTHGASVLSSVLASVSMPLLDGGAARAQVRAQQAALEQAQEVYRAAVLGALKEVEDALLAMNNDRLRLASLRVAAEAAVGAALLARQRYTSGLTDFQTVLETQRNQLATQDGVVSALADVGRDQVRLFTALGGGWRPPDSRAERQADPQQAAAQ